MRREARSCGTSVAQSVPSPFRSRMKEKEMAWNYAAIEDERRRKADARFGGASREELLERIVALETALYPYWIALSPIIDGDAWRGTTVTSKLFPMRPEEDDSKFLVFDPESKASLTVDVPEERLAEVDYYEEGGLCIKDGSKLADDFTLLAFHQQAPGCYIGCGSIDVADVKRTVAVMMKDHPNG